MIDSMPHHFTTGTHAACLQTGAASKDDHDVFAETCGDAGLSHSQAFAGPNHENDGDNAPSDTKHRQQGSELVAPECLQGVNKQVFESHCRTSWLPSLRPSINSVLTPFEIPSFTAMRVLPFSAFESGISRNVLRSLS